MSKFFIGTAFSAFVIGVVARVFFHTANITLPFSLGWIDFAIVIAAAACLGLSAYSLILKKYPDTREMLPLFSVIVCLVIISSYVVLRYQEAYQTSLSILVTGVFVGMGWWIQSITNAAGARRTHTLNIIMSSRTSAEYQAQSRNMNKAFRAAAMAPELAEWRVDPNKDEFKDMDVPDDLREAIDGSVYILNYYEFLAQGINFRDLDDCLLRECFSSILEGLERRNFHLIVEAQKADQRAYEGLIRLTKEWCGESVVEKYRANPANAPIGPIFPPKDEMQKILTAKAKPAATVTPIHQPLKAADDSGDQAHT
ncbi:hypothetical protein TUM18999_57250 [Pseudomonas tohonis]|uniref:DUF4760 domain-containing protein n=1 Tax=Pseudomonas tohonis TaxID=2725477 RepID=A0A6J4EEQ2_9PSED|nr:DUF4760 domain-containing protein [Pseudomonas tohonis]BCG27534.1 hypothetical protein TUM18999_57250 [Pseudomonas tohonis]